MASSLLVRFALLKISRPRKIPNVTYPKVYITLIDGVFCVISAFFEHATVGTYLIRTQQDFLVS